MKKSNLLLIVSALVASLLIIMGGAGGYSLISAKARTVDEESYFTVYNGDNMQEVLFMKGDSVAVNDEYISSDNKLYVIESVDEDKMVGVARYKEDVKMPVYNIAKKDNNFKEVSAAVNKRIGLYHTHNDECYNDEDGVDSIYGAGGIHDIGKSLKKNLEKLSIKVFYSENLHLPHNSGAYTRSEQTASELLQNDLDAIFDIHRDATPRREYITEVNGTTMSKVRIVIGSANKNSETNKEFALNIKAYADAVYPGLIKDIYIGKGNYNQQLYSRSLLFEMGTNLIEKEYVRRATEPLAKTIDVVLYGTRMASSESLSDFNAEESSGDMLDTGLVSASKTANGTPATHKTLWIVLGSIGAVAAVIGIVAACSKRFRAWLSRFFSEIFAVFKKRPANKN